MQHVAPTTIQEPGSCLAVQGSTTPRSVRLRGQLLVAVFAILALFGGSVGQAQPALAAAGLKPATPKISGTARVGSTLTAKPGTWKPAGVQFRYQWYRSGKVIPTAVTKTYTLVAADKGKRITVKVTGALAGYKSASRTSKKTKKVAAGFLTAAQPRISGQPTAGSVLTAVPGAWKPSAVTFAYVWYRSSKVVKGATGSTYPVSAGDVGTRLTVKVTGALPGYSSRSKTSAPTEPVSPEAPKAPITAQPTVTGEFAVGSTLAAVPGNWSAGTSFSYRWLRDGSPRAGATGDHYTLEPADEGTRIKVEVTGTVPGHPAATRTSVTSPRVLLTSTPRYGGDIAVGRAIEAQPGSWTSGTTFTYQWLRDGAPISGATSPTYTLTSADADKEASLVVTGTKDGYATVSRTSPLHFRVMILGTPTIAGSPRVGATLTLDPGTWSKSVKTLTQWLRDGAAISGATTNTYNPTPADVGKRLSVEMIGYASGYATIGTASASTEPVSASAITTGTPAITGDVRVGGNVSASPGSWGPEPVSLAYQWLIDGSIVNGATAQSWTISAAATGKSISVRVTGTKTGYDPASRTSSAVVVHNAGDRITPGTRLGTDDFLLSGDGRFQLIMQGDGNLVLYQLSPRRALWATNTSGGGNWAVLQTDGNLVVYTAGGKALWGSATDRKSVRDLVMQNDGNLVIYQTDGRALWASNTAQTPTGPGVLGDDYPANLKAAPKDALVDPWNFYNRECTSFVAWRLNNANKVAFTNQYKGAARWGNAGEWGGVAKKVGVTVNNTPARGAVAWTAAGSLGHVAWVAAVNGDGTITIEEYNYNYNGNYSSRKVSASSFQYIHIKDL